MTLTQNTKLLIGGLIGALLLGALFVLDVPQRLTARVLEGEAFRLIQIKSDYDRDGDIDFLDFTVFSAFYEEDI